MGNAARAFIIIIITIHQQRRYGATSPEWFIVVLMLHIRSHVFAADPFSRSPSYARPLYFWNNTIISDKLRFRRAPRPYDTRNVSYTGCVFPGSKPQTFGFRFSPVSNAGRFQRAWWISSEPQKLRTSTTGGTFDCERCRARCWWTRSSG